MHGKQTQQTMAANEQVKQRNRHVHDLFSTKLKESGVTTSDRDCKSNKSATCVSQGCRLRTKQTKQLGHATDSMSFENSRGRVSFLLLFFVSRLSSTNPVLLAATDRERKKKEKKRRKNALRKT